MAMSVGGGSGGIKSEINVTPLVDVVLVLLIIFMVVTPMLQRGKDVRLPKASKIEKEEKSADPIVLSVTPDKRIFLEADAFDEALLEEALRSRLAAAPGRKVLLKGDEVLTFGDVRRVMNLARKAGTKGVALGVEELKEK
ncbi:MAG: biopolymer transporter ExbD [Myxococcales bacterium]|nr:biopolymer transporter ExbD [Myxococcales bacterium]